MRYENIRIRVREILEEGKPSKKLSGTHGGSSNVNEMLGNPPGGNFTGEGKEMEESDFTYAAAKAAVAGKKTFKFGGEEHPVKMSKDKASKIVDEMDAVKREIDEVASIIDEILNESNATANKKARASHNKVRKN